MTPAEIAAALGAARREGRSWRCLCPAHDDSTPSLSITEKNGKTLFICRAGCEQGAVLDALRQRGIWPEPEKRDPQLSRIVAVYDYNDAEGRLRYQVVRLEPKKFFQRRPNGADGSFINNVVGVEPLPYRLPDLLHASPNGVVFVVEGEKDVDRLASLGLVATCNPGGAGKWRSDFNVFFQGRDVVILPDNDDAGHAHALSVATNLAPVAARVRILELPSLAPKDDVSNWLDGAGSREELEKLAAAAPAFSLENVTEAVADQGNTLDDEAEIARLAKLPTLQYDRERQAAAERLGIRVSILDRLVKAERGNGGAGHGQGQPVELFEPEPWSEPVDGAALLNLLTTAIRRYVILDLHQARAVALWVLFTHHFAAAAFAPKLIITSPQKRSGKTRLLQVLSYLVPRAKATSQITGAAMFRLITDHTPVLPIDEADAFVRDDEGLRDRQQWVRQANRQSHAKRDERRRMGG